MECFLCGNNEDLIIKKYNYWTVIIHPNQCYLGRCMVKLNRHTVDLFDITKEEKDELFEIMRNLREALKSLFKPDLFNYASLGNQVQHLHVHFVPRYKEKRVFKNIEFKDENWGRNFSPHGGQKLPTSVLDKLRKEIKQKLG